MPESNRQPSPRAHLLAEARTGIARAAAHLTNATNARSEADFEVAVVQACRLLAEVYAQTSEAATGFSLAHEPRAFDAAFAALEQRVATRAGGAA